MKELKELKEIYNNLNNGVIYGKMYDYGFSSNMYVSVGGKYIVWLCYGQSAERNTLKDLSWLLENIFETTPKEFIKTHVKYKNGKVID